MAQRGFAPIFIILLIATILGAGGFFVYQRYSNSPSPQTPPDQVACTQEAKLCPDGSSVGRTGPNCEFTACPTPKESTSSADISTWKTYTENNFSFKYPPSWFFNHSILTNYDITKVKQVLGMPDNDRIKIDVYEVPGTKKPTYSGEPPNDSLVSESMIVIGGEKAWKQIVESYVEGGGKTIIISIPHDNQTVRLEVRPADTKYQDTLNQILSTFKFLP